MSQESHERQKQMLERLRQVRPANRFGQLGKESDEPLLEEWNRNGVKFAASGARLEEVYYSALRSLFDCMVPTYDRGTILQ